jgi:hypothetical protein
MTRVANSGYMSQWAASPFEAEVEIDGRVETCGFATAEHWMMLQKALLFGDTAVAREILASSELGEVKALGRKVANFEEEKWVAERYRIVVEGNIRKFRAHEEMRGKLLETGDKRLVEASPRDRIWGIGFGHRNALRQQQRWGLNLLGQALEEVREAISTSRSN